jgi:hypothetical protein
MLELGFKPYRLLRKLNRDKQFHQLPDSRALAILLSRKFVDREFEDLNDNWGSTRATGRYCINDEGEAYCGNRSFYRFRWVVTTAIAVTALIISLIALLK